MSRRLSRGKGVASGRGKGVRREVPLCGRGLLVLMTLMNQFIIFCQRAIVISPKIALSEDTITGKKIGQNVGTVRIV
jgi:hypothetical protein